MDESRFLYEALYALPVEVLELSKTSLSALKRSGVTKVGDCCEFFIRLRTGSFGSPKVEFIKAMCQEVQPRLKALGYWSDQMQECYSPEAKQEEQP